MIIFDDDGYYIHSHTLIGIRQRIALWMARRELGTTPDERTYLITAESLWMLNRWARYRQYGFKDDVYRLKTQFLQSAFAHGYLKSARLVQQVIKCNRCERGVWARGTHREDICWHCGGSGVYKHVLLVEFIVKIGEREFVWHQPADHVNWRVWLESDLVDGEMSVVPSKLDYSQERIASLPKFKDLGKAQHTELADLSQWQLIRHLMRLAAFVSKYQMFERVELYPLRKSIKHDARKTLAKTSSRIALFLYRIDLMSRKVDELKDGIEAGLRFEEYWELPF